VLKHTSRIDADHGATYLSSAAEQVKAAAYIPLTDLTDIKESNTNRFRAPPAQGKSLSLHQNARRRLKHADYLFMMSSAYSSECIQCT
jgi:hypothetical protein